MRACVFVFVCVCVCVRAQSCMCTCMYVSGWVLAFAGVCARASADEHDGEVTSLCACVVVCACVCVFVCRRA